MPERYETDSCLHINWLMQIYYASEEYGVADVRTSGGYFHMAEVFHQQHNTTVAQSLYLQVALLSTHPFDSA